MRFVFGRRRRLLLFQHQDILLALAVHAYQLNVRKNRIVEATAVEARKGRLRGTAADLGVDTLASGTILCEWSKHENKAGA